MTARRVSEAMLRRPATQDRDATVADVRALLADDHVVVALLVDGERLVAVLDRGDLDGVDPADRALPHGRVDGRTVGPDEDVEALRLRMVADGVRRLAVVDGSGRLLGLLCLKRSGRGFCSDADVEARAAERGFCVED